MGVVLAAGGSFQWFRNELGKAEVALAKAEGRRPLFPADRRGRAGRPGRRGALLPPLLTGERTPHFDPDAKGAWIGLTVRHGRAHMIRSLLEGATFAMRDSLELIREMGVAIEQVRVSGGGARNALWRQIQADIYGCDVHTLNSTEGPAFGVALLAQVGTGGFASVPEACDATIRSVDSTAVDPRAKAYYDRAFAVYRQLYLDLRESFQTISSLVERREKGNGRCRSDAVLETLGCVDDDRPCGTTESPILMRARRAVSPWQGNEAGDPRGT